MDCTTADFGRLNPIVGVPLHGTKKKNSLANRKQALEERLYFMLAVLVFNL